MSGSSRLNELAIKTCGLRTANKCQRRVDLGREYFKHVTGPFLARSGEPIEDGTSQQHRFGTERQRLCRICSAAYAAIDEERRHGVLVRDFR